MTDNSSPIQESAGKPEPAETNREMNMPTPDAQMSELSWAPASFTPAVVKQAFGSQTLSAYTLMLESWRRGLTIDTNDPRGVQFTISDGLNKVHFNGSRSSRTTPHAIRVVDDKNETLKRLISVGVPTPKSELILTSKTSSDEALVRAQNEFNWPVVLKPVRGSQGKGVFANITTPEDFLDAYDHLQHKLQASKVLLEEHAFGSDYRIYVVGNKAVAACKRVPAHVVGDGTHTVNQLIKYKNTVRRENPFLSKGLIRPDVETDWMLRNQGLNYDSIPAQSQRIQLRQKANASAGGDVEDVTNHLPARILQSAAEAVQAIEGLEAAGVDVLINEKPKNGEIEFVIIELNARAHIGVNMYPTRGQGQNVPKHIIDHFFPKHRQTNETEKQLIGINLKSALRPLKESCVSNIQLKSLAPHHYPYRIVANIPSGLTINKVKRQSLQRNSRKFCISGALQNINDNPELIMAGTKSDVLSYLKFCEDLLGTSLQTEIWHGALYEGFSITPERHLMLQ